MFHCDDLVRLKLEVLCQAKMWISGFDGSHVMYEKLSIIFLIFFVGEIPFQLLLSTITENVL